MFFGFYMLTQFLSFSHVGKTIFSVVDPPPPGTREDSPQEWNDVHPSPLHTTPLGAKRLFSHMIRTRGDSLLGSLTHGAPGWPTTSSPFIADKTLWNWN